MRLVLNIASALAAFAAAGFWWVASRNPTPQALKVVVTAAAQNPDFVKWVQTSARANRRAATAAAVAAGLQGLAVFSK